MPHLPGLFFPGSTTKWSIVLEGELGSFSRGLDKDSSCALCDSSVLHESSLKCTLNGKDVTTKSRRAFCTHGPENGPLVPSSSSW